MKTILIHSNTKLPQSYLVKVSDEDYQYLSIWRWVLAADGKVVRAKVGGITKVPMANLVLERMGQDLADDEIPVYQDQDQRNCQRDNLTKRKIDVSKERASYASRYRGVAYAKHSPRQPWRATINHDGQQIPIGYYASEEEAARAYDAKARELKGAKAHPNFND